MFRNSPEMDGGGTACLGPTTIIEMTISMSESSSGANLDDPWVLAGPINFNAAIFADLNSSGFGAIIRNERDEVMAAMSVKGPPVNDGEEAKIPACWKALEFSIDAGFLELIIEGDNANVMRSISSPNTNHFLLDTSLNSNSLCSNNV